MRAGDIASLKLDSLDFKNQRICFIQNKTGSVSELYMVPEIKTALMDYLSTDRPASTSDYVFLNHVPLIQKYRILLSHLL